MIFPLEKLKILIKNYEKSEKSEKMSLTWLGPVRGGGHQNGKKFLCISGQIRPFRSYKKILILNEKKRPSRPPPPPLMKNFH